VSAIIVPEVDIWKYSFNQANLQHNQNEAVLLQDSTIIYKSLVLCL